MVIGDRLEDELHVQTIADIARGALGCDGAFGGNLWLRVYY